MRPIARSDDGPVTHTIVRFATLKDTKAMGELGTVLVQTHHDLDEQRFLAATPTTPHAYASFLASQFDIPESILLVGERAGQIVGYAYAGLEDSDYMALRGPAGVLYDLVVDPAHRRQGIGRLLLETALQELAEHKPPRVVLFTAERNVPAQRLFAACGFRPTMIEMTQDFGDKA